LPIAYRLPIDCVCPMIATTQTFLKHVHRVARDYVLCRS